MQAGGLVAFLALAIATCSCDPLRKGGSSEECESCESHCELTYPAHTYPKVSGCFVATTTAAFRLQRARYRAVSLVGREGRVYNGRWSASRSLSAGLASTAVRNV